jgi:hypothetical protein
LLLATVFFRTVWRNSIIYSQNWLCRNMTNRQENRVPTSARRSPPQGTPPRPACALGTRHTDQFTWTNGTGISAVQHCVDTDLRAFFLLLDFQHKWDNSMQASSCQLSRLVTLAVRHLS